jgi:multidrug resistance efflux pump
MLSLFSTLGGLLISGLPKLLEYFQNKADQKHELALAQMQTERELQLAAAGFAAQAKIEEIRTEQVAMQTQAQMAEAEASMV